MKCVATWQEASSSKVSHRPSAHLMSPIANTLSAIIMSNRALVTTHLNFKTNNATILVVMVVQSTPVVTGHGFQ